MGSFKDPRACSTDSDQALPACDARPRATIRLTCPPEFAVAFLAKVYSASPRLQESGLTIARTEPEGPGR